MPAVGTLDSLLVAARANDPRAQFALGRRMLVGEGLPPAPEEAVALLQKSARGGVADAAAQLSVCAAWGVGQSRDIPASLDWLRQAAQLGSNAAQEELRVLARASGDDWAGLRAAIDVAALTAPRQMRLVSQQPSIATIEGFCSLQEADHLIRRGGTDLKPALVYRGTADARAASSRTNTESAFTIFRADVVLNLIRERMAATLHVATQFFEVTKLLHYAPGEQFGLHADFLQLNTPELVKEVELRGQRAVTFLVYLNDAFTGGETEFPRIDYRYKGGSGDALVFRNIDTAGAPDYSTVHAGLAPLTGEKWLLSQWIRSKPVR